MNNRDHHLPDTRSQRWKHRTFPRLKLLVLLPIVATLAACGSGDDATGPDLTLTVTGSWTGTTGQITLQLTLSEQAGGNVVGSGNISAPGVSFALTVLNGTHAYPSLSLTLGATGVEDMNLSGTVTSATTIAATLNGSGFNNVNITLNKQ